MLLLVSAAGAAVEPTRPARVGFRGDSGFGLRRTSKWPLGLLHLLGRVRATARYEVTWKDRMERMVRTDVVGSYLQLLDSWPTKCVAEVVESVTSGQGWELLVQGGLASHYVSLKIPRRSHRERGGDCGEKD